MRYRIGQGQMANGRQDPEGNYLLAENEVVTIKSELIGLMTSVPPAIQSQLGDAISVIADSDFWTRWDTLVDVCIQWEHNNIRMLKMDRILCRG